MRILLVTPFVPHPQVGHGTATVAGHWVEYFARRHDVSVLAFSFGEHEVVLARKVAHVAEITTLPFPDGIARLWRARAESLTRGVPYTIQVFALPEMRAKLAKILNGQRFDLVQFDTTFMGQYRDVVPSDGPRTVLVEIDVTTKPLARRVAGERSVFKRAWYRHELLRMRRYEPALCRRFDRVFAVSSEDRDELLGLDSSLNVSLFRYGAEPSLFDIQPKPQNDRNVLFVGAFLHRPNVDAVDWYCRSILPAVRAAVPAANFTCVGANPPDWLQTAAASHGATLTGWVPDVARHLAHADVCVVPLRSGGGVKLKTLEMMAAERAVVTTPIGIEGLDARHGEHVLVAETAAEFASHVVALLGDDRLRTRLGRAARKLARANYQWVQNLHRLEQEFVELVESPDRLATVCAG